MFRLHLRTFVETPLRLWKWAQLHPYESVGYRALLFLVLFAGVVITLADAIVIISKLWHILKTN